MMTAMGLPPAACFSDCHLSAKPRGGSDNTSPAWETSSPPARRRLSGWYLETLRRKAGLEHNKSPQDTWRGWVCELWCSVWAELVRWGNCESANHSSLDLLSVYILTYSSCPQSLLLWEHFSYLCFLLIAKGHVSSAGQRDSAQQTPLPWAHRHSPIKALPGKKLQPQVASARKNLSTAAFSSVWVKLAFLQKNRNMTGFFPTLTPAQEPSVESSWKKNGKQWVL